MKGFLRRILTVALAGAMAFPVVLSVGACTVNIKDNGDGTFDITPADPKPGENTGNQGTTPGGTTKPVEPVEPDYSMYSPLLQTVLTSEYYNDIIKKGENGKLNHDFNGIPNFDGGRNLTEGIPYRFLQSENVDVENIQLDKIKVTSSAYTLKDNNNDLYLKMDITYPNNNNNYTTQYLLKYKISDQEFKELKMLNQNEYIQSGFFIQELDNQNEPEVLGKFSIYKETYDGLLYQLSKSKKIAAALNDREIAGFTIKSYTIDDENNYYLDCLIFGKDKSTKSYYTTRATSLNTMIYRAAGINFSDNILAIRDTAAQLNKEVGEGEDINCFSAYQNRIQLNNMIK